MRFLVMLLLLTASLFAEAGPVRAQATADQLNKLSLEALTAPQAGGGYGRASYRSRRSHASSGRRSYARSYRGSSHRRARFGGYRTTTVSRYRTAARHVTRSYRRSYRGHSHAAHRHRQHRRRT